jgi:UDP-glucose:(heptosyl)LPS alpha-1,3-glucosyltransferase
MKKLTLQDIADVAGVSCATVSRCLSGREGVGNKTRELETLAQGVAADIRFEGVSDHVLDYYLASDLMVHPARSEATGTVLIEALSCGLPVICTGLCGFSTYVQEAGAGHVLYGEFHQGELNAAVESLLADREHLKYLGQEALDYTQHTNLTGRASVIVDLLEEYHGTR